MKKKRIINFAFAILMIGLTAAPFATAGDITIFDGMPGSGAGPAGEINEVEPGNLQSHAWDLEAFYLKGNKLYLIGGFNFQNGQADPYRPGNTYYSGDIFISTTGIPKYGLTNTGSLGGGGSTYPQVANGYGYNYVIDFARDSFGKLTGSYDVVTLTSSSTVDQAYFSQNGGSNPFQYVSGGTPIGNGTFTLYTGKTTQEIKDLLGDQTINLGGNGVWTGNHNALVVDLAFLGLGEEFYSHFTEGCGNDDLMGHGTTPVPEPGTMILLGSGLVGLAGWGRKKYRK